MCERAVEFSEAANQRERINVARCSKNPVGRPAISQQLDLSQQHPSWSDDDPSGARREVNKSPEKEGKEGREKEEQMTGTLSK